MLFGRTGRSVAFALAAAALYALSTPFSKVLLADVAPNMMAALLYLGAGAGMTMLSLASGARGGAGEVRGRCLERADAPYVAAMVVLDVAAPLLLMAGLSLSSAESVSLLNNFEIVATALIARLMFGERVGTRTATGIGVISLACVLRSSRLRHACAGASRTTARTDCQIATQSRLSSSRGGARVPARSSWRSAQATPCRRSLTRGLRSCSGLSHTGCRLPATCAPSATWERRERVPFTR